MFFFRRIIIARCPYFDTMLDADFKEKKGKKIVIKKYGYEAGHTRNHQLPLYR